MAALMRNLIQYEGINSCNYTNAKYFNQVIKDFTFCVPTQKPDIEQIVKVWVDACVITQKIVKTPIGTSLEGQTVTGYKLMLEGEITYKVQYVALEETQTLHTAHTTVPFCGYIVLPEKFNPNAIITTSIGIEDADAKQLDTRCIYNSVTMILVADIC